MDLLQSVSPGAVGRNRFLSLVLDQDLGGEGCGHGGLRPYHTRLNQEVCRESRDDHMPEAQVKTAVREDRQVQEPGSVKTESIRH